MNPSDQQEGSTLSNHGLGVGIAVAEVVVKDVVLPPEIRAAYAELATTGQRSHVQA